MIDLYQSPVLFDETEHKYWLDGKELKGVTGTLIKRAFPNTYNDIPKETLQKAAERGHAIHKCIEEYEKESKFDDIPELISYVRIKEEQKLTHIAAEYLISDEERYASQIDHIFIDENGEIVIADVKTTYKPLYDHVALQLSIYKRMFEQQNKKLEVSKCVLMWLRGDKYEYKELTPWGDEFLDDLFAADINDKVFDITKTYGDLPIKVAEVENYLIKLENEWKRINDERNAIKEGLCQLMLEKGVKKYTTSRLQMTTVTPKPKKTFDTKRFQQEHKDLYDEYLNTSEVKPSIRVTIK